MTTEGRIVHSAKEQFTYDLLDNGGIEIGAKDYLATCFRALKKLSDGADNGIIKGVCASSASGNLLLLDRDGCPMTNIINWQDQRVTDEAKEMLKDIDADKIYQYVGWPYDFRTFPLSQLCYMKKHNPQLLRDCAMACMSTEYLYHALTGRWGISISAGTTYYLINQQKGQYMQELLELLGMNESQFPPVMSCGTVLGTVTRKMESVCGVPAGTPVVLGSFDHPSAARGAGILKEGEMLLSCGTSWVAFFPISDREKGTRARMLVDPFLSPKGCYGAMTSIPSLAGRIQLYVYRYIDDSADAFQTLSTLARESQAGANGLKINPLEEPDDEKIKAYGQNDIARAIMEGTVELLKKRLDSLEKKGIAAKTAVMVGGPSEDLYWISLIEEICDISVCVEHGAFAGAVGAAIIAGVGISEYESEDAAHQRFQSNGEKD